MATFDVFAYRRNFVRAAPLVLVVPVVLGLVLIQGGAPLDLGALVLGVVGWFVALALRTPLPILIVHAVQGDRMRADPIIAVAGGVIAEVVRLGVVLVVTLTAPGALWVGLGWGAAEAVFAIVSGAAIVAMIGGDPEADQAISMLPMRNQTRSDAPLWGVLERIWVTGLHMGWTLLVAASPVLVVVTIVAHAATEFALQVPTVVIGLPRAQLIGFAWAAITLWIASVAWASLTP